MRYLLLLLIASCATPSMSAHADSPTIETVILQPMSHGKHDEVGRVVLCQDTQGRFIVDEDVCLKAIPDASWLKPIDDSVGATLRRSRAAGVKLYWSMPDLVYTRGDVMPERVEDEARCEKLKGSILSRSVRDLELDTEALLEFELISQLPGLADGLTSGAIDVRVQYEGEALRAKLDGDARRDLLLGGTLFFVHEDDLAAHEAALRAKAEERGRDFDGLDAGDVLDAAAHRIVVMGVVSGRSERVTPVGLYEMADVLGELEARGRLGLHEDRDGDHHGVEFQGGELAPVVLQDLAYLHGWDDISANCWDIDRDGQVEADLFIGGDGQNMRLVVGFDHEGRFGPISPGGFFGP